MRILTLAHDLHALGGLERCQLAICTELGRRGHEISLAYLRDGDLHGQWDEVTAHQAEVGAMRIVPQQALRSTARFGRAVRGQRRAPIDLVYASHYRQLQLAAAIARSHRVPLVFHVHNIAPKALGPLGRRQVRWPHRSVVVSESNARMWWDLGLERATTRIVHNGVDTERFRPGEVAGLRRERNVPATAFTVAFVGGTANGKGAGVLLDAWRSLGLAPDAGRLLILGRPDDELRGRLAALTDPEVDTVRVVGQQTDVAPWLRLSDVVAVPSNGHDPCPLAVLEGLASGRPVVGSRIGGIPEMLTGPLAGLLVEPGDAIGLAGQLRRLRDDPDEGRRLGSIGRRHVVDGFTLDRMVDDLEGVFADVVEPAVVAAVRSMS
jgi:glycosyltransferase involved in cell wall biosynthesis